VVLLVNNGCLALSDELAQRFPGCVASVGPSQPPPTAHEGPGPPRSPPFTLVLGTTTHGAFRARCAHGGEVLVHAGFGRAWFGLPGPAGEGTAAAGAAGQASATAAAAAPAARVARSVGLLARSGLCGDVPAGCTLDPQIEVRLWQKLCANAVLNPLTALWRCENGAVLARADGRSHARAVAGEVSLVARARAFEAAGTALAGGRRGSEGSEGAEGGGGAEGRLRSQSPAPDLPDLSSDPLSAEALYAFVEACAAENAKNKSSMFMDLSAGRRTEVAFLNGWVADEGRRLGVATPSNAALTEAVQRAEAEAKAAQTKGARAAVD